MGTVTWDMRLYDIGGSGISASDPVAGSSNRIWRHFDTAWTVPLNGVDSLNFSLYLDDPMAAQIKRLRTVVKLWRTVRNNAGSVVYSDSNPCFGGVVSYTNKSGDANTMNIICSSPFWRLQSRFHILNHYLKINVDTGDEYRQSELMWKLIDLVNNAFGLDDSNTGIIKGTFAAANDPVVAPYFVPKGSNTWANIFDDIMMRPGGVDIVPEYQHIEGDPGILVFNTAEKRGGTGATMRYRTGSGDNLDDLTEEEQPIPGEFANYLWAVGAGGPNSGKIAMEENIDDDADGYSNIGIYMRRADFDNIKKIGLIGPPPTHLRAVANAEFAQSRIPKTNYTCVLSPVGDTHYGANFNVGDVVNVIGSKGALNVNVDQRIFQTTTSLSPNSLETCELSLADDFTENMVS